MIGIQTDLRPLRVVDLRPDKIECAADVKLKVLVLKQCPLTDHQLKVLQMAAEGFDNLEMSERLGVARRTIETHMARILEKTGARNRTAAAVTAVREGWI